ncbi:MAG: hypothetical protein ACM3ON_13110 [Chloroflexota bacterium]
MEPINPKEARKYPVIAALAALILLGSVVGFNLVVDPYAMYRLVEIRGFNTHKPAVYHRVRLAKAYEVRRLRPQAIILGTSRSHLGLRPSHEGWESEVTRRYNLAFDGATTKEMYYYLLHAHAVQPLKQVVLGLDTYHPTGAPASVRPDFDPQILGKPGSLTSRLGMMLADLKLLVSIDTVKASIDTLRSQDDGEPEWFAADGQRLGEVFFRRPGENFVKYGPRAYFEEIDRLEVGFKTEGMRPVAVKASHRPAAPQVSSGETSLAYIRRIVEFCRAEHIDLRIFITPEHAHQMEINVAVGAWSSVEIGKRELVRMLQDEHARHPGERPFALYDFSGYSTVTTEALPEPGSHAEMTYYWDSSHFKATVGDMVLDRLFGYTRPGRPVPEDFGVRLTPDSIESALKNTRTAQAAYRMSHPEDISAIRSLVEESTGHRPGNSSVAMVASPAE